MCLGPLHSQEDRQPPSSCSRQFLSPGTLCCRHTAAAGLVGVFVGSGAVTGADTTEDQRNTGARRSAAQHCKIATRHGSATSRYDSTRRTDSLTVDTRLLHAARRSREPGGGAPVNTAGLPSAHYEPRRGEAFPLHSRNHLRVNRMFPARHANGTARPLLGGAPRSVPGPGRVSERVGAAGREGQAPRHPRHTPSATPVTRRRPCRPSPPPSHSSAALSS